MYCHTLNEDIENVKNYCKYEVEPNSILCGAYHITEDFWFISSQNTFTFIVVCPQKQKETDCKPTFRYNQTKHVLYCYR